MASDSTVPLAIFSADLALSRHGGDREALRAALREALVALPRQIEGLMGGGDAIDFVLRAGALRDAFSNVGAVAGVAAVGAFELAAQTGVREHAVRECRRVEAAWVALAPHLERHLARLE
ncbi:MAG: hypothetical protein JNK72_00585 [Myxococcales bacterium]|nr:hypothetical protein [Myxococcales bacterium]